MAFSLEKAIFWRKDLYLCWKQWFEVKNILMMDLFITYMQPFTSFGLLVDYCDVLMKKQTTFWMGEYIVS